MVGESPGVSTFWKCLKKIFLLYNIFQFHFPIFFNFKGFVSIKSAWGSEKCVFSRFNSCYKVYFHTEEASVAPLAAVVAHFHGCCSSWTVHSPNPQSWRRCCVKFEVFIVLSASLSVPLPLLSFFPYSFIIFLHLSKHNKHFITKKLCLTQGFSFTHHFTLPSAQT